MESFRLDDLIELLKEAGEQDESATVVVSEDDADSSFEELGLDSLTLLNVVVHIEKKYSIGIGFAAVTDAKTPNELFLLVQSHLMAKRKIA
ncbi:acyl carrier protein [Dyella tabacisoli]|uniref:Acyl carrier protein n=1 Tax=Dyella tabacisoli TaxID=2282381 RepID=A0A369URZ2_9GAMM|nr:acyl carrier protein [Dyella tabacisoli]RDD83083.1 acyl carrier protein [Dyella tabacisoli]